MTTFKTQSALLALLMSCASLTACGDDDNSTNSDAGDVLDGSTAFICDPEGTNPAMGALLNAPVENDVEVIEKEPQHPGDPGPENLP